MKTIFIAIFLILAGFTFVSAQPGALDTTFAATGIITSSTVRTAAVQTDGKIIVGGSFGAGSGVATMSPARLNADGSFDTTFNVGNTGASITPETILVQPDGKIMIGGNFATYNGSNRRRIARLNANGSLDTTFVTPTNGFDNEVYEIALQTDGKYIVVGDFFSYGGTATEGVARLNADGSLDTTFTVGTGATGGIVFGAAIQTDGKILISGNFTSYNGTAINRLARLNADGTLDTTFVVGTGAGSTVFDVALDINGEIVITGAFQFYNSVSVGRIARLSSTGALDTSFNANVGAGANNITRKIAIDASGMIYAAGFFTTFSGATHNRLARMFSNGVIDASYNPSVTGSGGDVKALILQADGKAVIAGDLQRLTDNELRFNVARVNADGTNDDTFETVPGAGSSGVRVNKIEIKPNGKILLAGIFQGAGRFSQINIVQLNDDGTVDTAFASDQAHSGANGEIFALALQTDGKILIGGAFTDFNGTAINRLARLNADGTIDNTFTVGTGANANVRAIAVQPDGKILIGGNLTSYNGAAVNRIARLNADGTLDGTFTTAAVTTSVNAITLQTDGKILIGGAFTNFDGSGIANFVRLETNGARDVNFNTGGAGASGTVLAIAIEADGRILIGGAFATYNGTAHSNIARTNADGTDAAFSANLTGTSSEVRSIAVQVDGKIIPVGQYGNCNGVIINHCRLNVNGTRDTLYNNSGAGFVGAPIAAALQADNRLVIGGSFTSYNGTLRANVARILFDNIAVWNGSVSSNWNTAANWTPAAVPANTTPIFITSTTVPFEPTLDSSRSLSSLTVQAGKTLTVPTGLTLTVAGFSNSGTITGAGTLAFTTFAGIIITNNGTISTSAAQVSGATRQLLGTGEFTANNTFSIVGGSNFSLGSNHQFGTLKNVSGSLNMGSGTVRLNGAGDALDPGATSSVFTCVGCTVEFNGTAAQTVQSVPTNYKTLIFNNPAGVSLTENVTVNNSAVLTDGIVNSGAFELRILQGGTLTRTNGYVIGKLSKQYNNGGENFLFAVGTANGYSPVQFNAAVDSAGGARFVTIETFQTNQPNMNAATSLARYWHITAGAEIDSANVVFNYLQTDVVGDENSYGIHKVSAGVPMGFPNDCANVSPCVDTANNTATINNVTQFSDWTVGEFAPLAATVSVGGRVTANGRAVAKATVTMVDANGSSRFARTNAFGYYRFDDVEVGQTVIVSVRHKQFQFAPQIVTVNEALDELNFSGNETPFR